MESLKEQLEKVKPELEIINFTQNSSITKSITVKLHSIVTMQSCSFFYFQLYRYFWKFYYMKVTILYQDSQMNLEQQSQNTKPGQFIEYNYRIVITFLFSLATFMIGMCWVTVTPISVPIQNAYNVSAGWVAFIPMSYMLFYIFVNFPSNWIIDVKGIKKGVVIGSCLAFLGCLIRCMVRFGFAFVIIGQVFCAIAQPFLVNAPMKIATRWYMPQNRPFAISFMTVMNFFGTAIGFWIPQLFVSGNDPTQTVKNNFFYLLIVQLAFVGVVGVLVILFFKQSPPTPPSHCSIIDNVQFTQSICYLAQNKSFMALALSFGAVNGVFNFYGSVLDNILQPYGFSTSVVSIIGTVQMLVGILASLIFSFYIQKTLNYHNTFIICGLIGVSSAIGLSLIMKVFADQSNMYLCLYLILFCLQGIVFISLQPLTIDYGCDTMFPVGETMVSGFMLNIGQIFGILFVQAAQQIFKLGNSEVSTQQQKINSFHSLVFSNVCFAVGCMVLMFQNEQLKRTKLQQENQRLQVIMKKDSDSCNEN